MMSGGHDFGKMHSTQTTTTTTTVRITRPFFDFVYIRTLPGILKFVQLVLDFITFICCIAGPLSYLPDVGWSTFVSITAFIVTLILLTMYMAHLIEMLQGIPWLLIECLYCGIWVFFFLIAACLMAAKSTYCGACQAYGAASFFGFMAMIAYGFDCFLKFNSWRNGDVAQGTPPTIAMRSSTMGP